MGSSFVIVQILIIIIIFFLNISFAMEKLLNR